MLVSRFTFLVKRGHRSELREILAAEAAEWEKAARAVRHLVPRQGCLDILVSDIEFEDMNEHNKHGAWWSATRGDAFWEKVNPLIEHVSHEFWSVDTVA